MTTWTPRTNTRRTSPWDADYYPWLEASYPWLSSTDLWKNRQGNYPS